MTDHCAITLLLGLCLATASSANAGGGDPDPAHHQPAKITFDLGRIDHRGLTGPPTGLHSLSYEFCIPRGEKYRAEVRAIDPSAKFQGQSPGRIGCGREQTLVIGDTHQARFREVLEALARLPYVERIDQAFFE